jgi:hypothetical protein
MIEDSKMVRVGGHGLGTGRLWRVALLTLAGAAGAASEADAAVYWSGLIPVILLSACADHSAAAKSAPISGKENRGAGEGIHQAAGTVDHRDLDRKAKLKIHDANGFFAETPISTGMRGHPTPMGVFSIIQKHKFHHSNIYSGAPMPYMQRITWSGVAMHAGVLPAIRLPMAASACPWPLP